VLILQESIRDGTMNASRSIGNPIREDGYVLVSAMALTLVLVAIGAAFMQWASDEAQQSQESVGGMQAYYAAQAGVIEKGLTWLRTQQAGVLPQSEISWTEVCPVVVDNKTIGRYENVRIAPVFGGFEESTSFFTRRQYSISAIGRVPLPWTNDGRTETKEMVRKAVLYVSVRSFADYMYLTEHEVTPNGELVRFWTGDTLWGRVHSNDTIRIMGRPVFWDIVSTGAPDFERGAGYNPDFRGPDPYFNAPEVEIPVIASTIRDNAMPNGRFFEHEGFEYRLLFRGSYAILFDWEEGAPFDSLTAHQVPIQGTGNTCIFVNGPLSLAGLVSGAWTVGCSHDIYLIDDVKYPCWNPSLDPAVPLDCGDFLGIVSETRVVIANTWANGRDNSSQGQDIVITAAIVGLGETTGSFTFDQQNDVGDAYIGPSPDDRGQIHLNGSVTQRYRGYVHRRNNISTGYLKDYKYDKRFLTHRPPCFMDAVDQSGRALFDIVQWGQAVENPNDVRANKRVLYN
jgi:hypothetical protein